MPDDNHKYDHIPIPTYEEATLNPGRSSRSRSSSRGSRGGLGGRSSLERQGFLTSTSTSGNASHDRTHGGHRYRPPTVESARSSFDSGVSLPELDSEAEDEGLRRDMEEMEYDDEAERRAQQRIRIRSGFSKRFASLQHTLSSIHLPSFRSYVPSFSFITSRIPALPYTYRPGWPILARLLGLFILISVIYGLVFLRVIGPRGFGGQQFPSETVRSYVQQAIDRERIEQNLLQVSFEDHIAGTRGDFFLAQWVEERFIEAELDQTFHEDFNVYLNFPKEGGRKVAIVSPSELIWQASLEEDTVPGKQQQHQTAVFHGLSKAGNVTGPLVYANYGSEDDFAFLEENGIELKGSIILMRYYGSAGDRALKVKMAESVGAVGCLIYTDPADDGYVRGPTWPEGRWRPSDSVQRGSVALTPFIVGDVLTPGWASTKGASRIPVDDNPGLVGIPSLPLAWRDAKPLLASIQNHGIVCPQHWVGGVPGIEWFTGGSSSPVVLLTNLQDEVKTQPIRNIIGKIQGLETPKKIVYVGNHRDAWCFGAVDPGSGTAIFLEVVRIFGELKKKGWRPLRSIVFTSWDGEEYNLIGSTEHVEDHIDLVRDQAIGYLNVDTGVWGEQFTASASPLLELPLLRVLDRVADPQTNETLRDKWHAARSKLGLLGAGSDYVAFQNLAGCSSLDMSFAGSSHGYPYHSCYETLGWMEKFGDPEFKFSAALGQIWALLILELADSPIVPYDMKAYAKAVLQYVQQLDHDVSQLGANNGDPDRKLDLHPLYSAAELFIKNADVFMEFEDHWRAQVMQTDTESLDLAVHRLSHNARMSNFETHLLDLPDLLPEEPDENGKPISSSSEREGGIPGRRQYKHILFGPSRKNGYDGVTFPAVRDAVEDQDWERAREQLTVVSRVLHHAADKLLN